MSQRPRISVNHGIANPSERHVTFTPEAYKTVSDSAESHRKLVQDQMILFNQYSDDLASIREFDIPPPDRQTMRQNHQLMFERVNRFAADMAKAFGGWSVEENAMIQNQTEFAARLLVVLQISLVRRYRDSPEDPGEQFTNDDKTSSILLEAWKWQLEVLAMWNDEYRKRRDYWETIDGDSVKAGQFPSNPLQRRDATMSPAERALWGFDPVDSK